MRHDTMASGNANCNSYCSQLQPKMLCCLWIQWWKMHNAICKDNLQMPTVMLYCLQTQKVMLIVNNSHDAIVYIFVFNRSTMPELKT